MLFKLYKYSPWLIIFFGIILSFTNNFGWDIVRTDNITYLSGFLSISLGAGVDYLKRNKNNSLILINSLIEIYNSNPENKEALVLKKTVKEG